MNFSSKLLIWYDINKRDLPWRVVDNPYVIWIAEVVFQQTRIEQGLPYFERFIKRFPSVTTLAIAKEDDVLKMWQGLGYYSRARNLHFSAKMIVNELDGVFPSSYVKLLKLKGVGPYIAAELASVCFNEVVAAVDGNVQRVISRYFGVIEPVNSSIGTSQVKEFTTAHISKFRPGDYNQALMDFGSMVCSPKKPNCFECVFSSTCFAFAAKKQNVLPIKIKKVVVKNRYFNFLIIRNSNSFLMQKREKGDVWQGLYQFPLIETDRDVTEIENLDGVASGYLLLKKKRRLTHQLLLLNFWVIDKLDKCNSTHGDLWVPVNLQSNYPVPKSIEEVFLSMEFNSLFNEDDN